MQIRDFSTQSGVSDKTIRYYESIGLLPPAARQPNGYRDYAASDLDRLKLVAGARRLDFSLDEIREILDLRDRQEPPCNVMLESLMNKSAEIQKRILELQQLDVELQQLHQLGLTFPTDDVEGKNCVCHLVSEKASQ